MSSTSRSKLAIVTGGSSGIGAATVRQLTAAGFRVVAGARRLDRLRAVTDPVGAAAIVLDVTDQASIDSFLQEALGDLPETQLDLLVNNAGGALGLERVEDARDDYWQWMYDANVLGTMRMCRALLPALKASGDGHIVNVGSIAGFESYPGGAGYSAAKHAARTLTRTLRLELLGDPVRITEIAPGLVETEFSIVRFDGDRDRAAKVYDGMEPLTADDVAECIVWAAMRPSRVNIDEMIIRPRDQAAATLIHRRT